MRGKRTSPQNCFLDAAGQKGARLLYIYMCPGRFLMPCGFFTHKLKFIYKPFLSIPSNRDRLAISIGFIYIYSIRESPGPKEDCNPSPKCIIKREEITRKIFGSNELPFYVPQKSFRTRIFVCSSINLSINILLLLEKFIAH